MRELTYSFALINIFLKELYRDYIYLDYQKHIP